MMELKDTDRLTTVHKQSDSFNVDGADGLNLSSKTPPGSSNRLDSVFSVKGISKALRTSISGIRDNKKLHILGTSGTTFNDSNNLYSSSKKFYQIGRISGGHTNNLRLAGQAEKTQVNPRDRVSQMRSFDLSHV